jgi:formylmethanofuran dehydrogenase subunit E
MPVVSNDAPQSMPETVPPDAEHTLEALLKTVGDLHRHLCPRQVLGVRMGLWAGELLQLELPQTGKRLMALVETDGCFADGVSVATNCWLGHRTLRLEDYGKVAATFLDTQSGAAVRLAAKSDARGLAREHAPEARNRWQGMLFGYQRMPVEELFTIQHVRLKQTVGEIVSRAGARAVCAVCGEEILNEREIKTAGGVLCRACATTAYYTPLE